MLGLLYLDPKLEEKLKRLNGCCDRFLAHCKEDEQKVLVTVENISK